jgi:hypothetical protein
MPYSPQSPWLIEAGPDFSEINKDLVTGEPNYASFDPNLTDVDPEFFKMAVHFPEDAGSPGIYSKVDLQDLQQVASFTRVDPEFNSTLSIPQNANLSQVDLDFNSMRGPSQVVNAFKPNPDLDKLFELLRNPGFIETRPIIFEVAPEPGKVNPEFAQSIRVRKRRVYVGEERLRLFLERTIYGGKIPDEFYFNPKESQCNVPALICCEVSRLSFIAKVCRMLRYFLFSNAYTYSFQLVWHVQCKEHAQQFGNMRQGRIQYLPGACGVLGTKLQQNL